MTNTIAISPESIKIARTKTSSGRKYEKIVWLDLGDFGQLNRPKIETEHWQDHGLALLRTILHKNGVMTDVASLRLMRGWFDVGPALKGYDLLLMNVRKIGRAHV